MKQILNMLPVHRDEAEILELQRIKTQPEVGNRWETGIKRSDWVSVGACIMLCFKADNNFIRGSNYLPLTLIIINDNTFLGIRSAQARFTAMSRF